jgi:transcriptional regulator with XRE-family HTH domain
MQSMSQKDLKRFGTRVRTEREHIGISQEELADRAGLHRTYLGAVERGERNLGLLNVIRIARALGVPITSLFSNIDK